MLDVLDPLEMALEREKMRWRGLRLRRAHLADGATERVQAVEDRKVRRRSGSVSGASRMRGVPEAKASVMRRVSHEKSPEKGLARREGFEPPLTVLETAVLPLNYRRTEQDRC